MENTQMIRKYMLSTIAGLAALPLFAATDVNNNVSGSLAATVQNVPGAGGAVSENNSNTSPYMDTQVQANLQIQVADKVKKLHFIRDNNDPFVVTKTYVLKHADPYALRSYLREMVQTKRVGGSNTAVECLKFEDGVGLLFVSAEDYRFESNENGMGIDDIVKTLDQPGLVNSSGSPKYIYFPANVPASVLEEMVKNVGMNVKNDPAELLGGKDHVALDPDLNCLYFNTASYSRRNIEEMLHRYDKALPEIRIKFRVYELYNDNDEKLGLDFQAWKNNEGMDFFNAGGRYRDNWAATYDGGMNRGQGSERTSYYNFNPKWNSKYLDFLTTKGKAKIAYTGEVAVRQNTTSTLKRTTELFYADTTVPAEDTPVLFDKLLDIFDKPDQTTNIKMDKANKENVTRNPTSFGFTMTVKASSIAPKAAMLTLTLNNSSLIGYQSSGAPRIQQGNTVSTDVMVSTMNNRFVIGGLEKREVVRGSTGVPYLKDIPVLGYLFGTESESTHKSQMVLVAECNYVAPEELMPTDTRKEIDKISNKVADAGGANRFFFKQYGLDSK